MTYGILIEKHNGYKIYHENGTYTIVDKKGDVIGTSNCIEGAYVVASLGKKGVNDIFGKKRGRR